VYEIKKLKSGQGPTKGSRAIKNGMPKTAIQYRLRGNRDVGRPEKKNVIVSMRLGGGHDGLNHESKEEEG
jgi:hypothetical protein